MAKIRVAFRGVDYWSRYIFINKKTKRHYCTVDTLYDEARPLWEVIDDINSGKAALYTMSSNDGEGEPEWPVDNVEAYIDPKSLVEV